uniref:Uncharacterized protein n=1 Tax=Cacopsylla melanoneura TaxID=428564 RepID=A0A8D9F5K5_9HEMI
MTRHFTIWLFKNSPADHSNPHRSKFSVSGTNYKSIARVGVCVCVGGFVCVCVCALLKLTTVDCSTNVIQDLFHEALCTPNSSYMKMKLNGEKYVFIVLVYFIILKFCTFLLNPCIFSPFLLNSEIIF